MFKAKVKAFFQLLFLLLNSFVLSLYSILFLDEYVDDLIICNKKIKLKKKKITNKDLKNYLNNCFNQ